jgi:hypothetical protein
MWIVFVASAITLATQVFLSKTPTYPNMVAAGAGKFERLTGPAALVRTSCDSGTLSLADLLAISKAGAGTDLLIRVIDGCQPFMHLDGEAVLALKSGGLEDRVVMELLERSRSARNAAVYPAGETALARNVPQGR